MSKVVILGNSIAGFNAAMKIRKQDSSSEVSILLLENTLPYNRDVFSKIISQEVQADEIVPYSKDFYVKEGIQLIENETVTRINFKHKKIYTESKNQYDFDKLIMTGFYDNKYPDIKGTNKNGLYGFNKLKDIRTLVDNLVFIDTVVIQSNTVEGLKLAAALLKLKKEVYLISSKDGIFSKAFSKEAIEIVRTQLENKGLTVIERNPIVEILGDSDLKAVRLQSQKIIGTQAVVFTDTSDNFKMFVDYDLNMMDGRIVVNSQYQTNYPDVYAVDVGITNPSDIVNFATYAKDSRWLEIEADVVASSICKSERLNQEYIQESDIKLPGLDLSLIGEFQGKLGYDIKSISSLGSKTYEKYVLDAQTLKGSVLLNTPNKKEQIARTIKEKEIFEWTEPSAQEQTAQDTKLAGKESVSVNASEQITSEIPSTTGE